MILLRLLLPLLAAVLLSACMGPRPQIIKREVKPPQSAGAPYIVIVTIQNTGRGDGQIEAVAKMRSKTTREIVAQATRNVDLGAFETVRVTFELKAPAGDEYDLSVEARYPP